MPDPLAGGTPESGQESRSADVLRSYLEGPGLELEAFESLPGRRSLVARIEGSDRDGPSLLLLGHTDVVPVNPEGWREDPFGGELLDGEVWGRGAVDMLNLTSSMAAAVRRLAREGWRPRGTLVFAAVADEEAGGALGAEWLAHHHPELVGCDYVLTESGGIPRPTPGGTRLDVAVGEKGIRWCRLRVRGTLFRPWPRGSVRRAPSMRATRSSVLHAAALSGPSRTSVPCGQPPSGAPPPARRRFGLE